MGPCSTSDQVNVFFGKYDITPSNPTASSGVMTLTYTSFLGNNDSLAPTHIVGAGNNNKYGNAPQLGESYVFFWSKHANTLNISSPIFGVDVIYMSMPSTRIDGTWSWQLTGQTTYNDFNGGNFLSITYTFNQGANQAAIVIGDYALMGQRINIFYAYGPEGFEGTTATGNYTDTGSSLTLNIYVNAVKKQIVLLNGAMDKPVRNVEGTWTGASVFPSTNGDNNFCLTTVEFHNSYWRGFHTQCSTGVGFSFGTFLGTFVVSTTSTIAFSYAFVDIDGKGSSGLAGQTLIFDYELLMSPGGMPELIISSDDPTQPVISLVQMP